MQVLILDTVHPLLLEGLRQMGFNLIEEYAASKDDLTPHLSEIYGVVLRSRLPIDKDFLAAAPKLHFIARVGAGMENIDTGAAARLGIHCFKAPEGNRDAVGEHALGMLLMMLNNLRRADAEVRNGQWRKGGQPRL
ncbi:MAG: hypothetical protein U5L96_11575 [Owenweeksia sp.]|nr:hypothetical protein [Owenweeksia sp.]